MKRVATAALFFLAASPAFACETVHLGPLKISKAWSRASIGTARPGVVYLTIRNTGTADDALLSITTPVSGMPMLHQTVVTDGVASMPHAMEVPLPAGRSAALEPGSYHGMLMGLTQVLTEGETFLVTLTFRDAGEVTVPVAIRGAGAANAGCPDSNG